MNSSPDLVTLTIDGHEVEVPGGTLVIRAAEQAGIHIPRFCDHPLLEPVGACRQCLVDVASPGPDGNLRAFPKPQPACTMPVGPGMVVNTAATSDAAKRAQEGVMELILLDHPLDCPICDRGGECPLQSQAMEWGRQTSRYSGHKKTYVKPIALTSQILLDRERCILCQRCTRFAAQIPGDPFIGLQMRGLNQQVGRFDAEVLGFAGDFYDEELDGPLPAPGFGQSADGQPFASYFSGNIIQACPVGALTSTDYRFKARPFDLHSVASVAEHDSSGSAIEVDIRKGQVVRRRAGQCDQVNQAWLSDKDRFGFAWQTAPDRLTTPLIRQNGVLQAASWPEAVAAAGRGLAAADGVGLLPGGRLTIEDALAYSLFGRLALETNDIDYRWRARSSEELDFLAYQVAGAGLGVTLEDLEAASGIVLAGFEPEEEGGIVFLRLRQAVKAGARVVSIASWASPGVRKLNGQLIAVQPGAEAVALTELAAALGADFPWAGTVIVVGERLAQVPGALSAAVRLAEQTGARLTWIPRRAGERAAVEAGLLPNLLPAGRSFDQADEVAAALGGRALPTAPGRDLAAILHAAANREIGALVVGGVDLADLPEAPLARMALEQAFTVCLEVRASAVTELADVVLPVAPPAEKPGTLINWEGRLRPFGQVLPTMALSDARVLQALAAELGCKLDLGLDAAHELLTVLGPPSQRAMAPSLPASTPPIPARGEALLATWHQLIDSSRGLDGQTRLAASGRAVVAIMSPQTAAENKLTAGDPVRVATRVGGITAPVHLADLPDRVVWLPTNSPDCAVIATLGVCGGIVHLEVPQQEVAA